MKIYLAGPMSGYPQFNFPLFYSAAASLRAQGFEVVSPAELDDATDAAIAMRSEPHPTKTWGDFLARDVKIIADGGVGGIVFLPNWYKSRGARLEATVGLLQRSDFAFFQYHEDRGVSTINRRSVAWSLFDAAVSP